MCYKDEKQEEYEKMLDKALDKYKVPRFLQSYFVGINSKVGAVSYWSLLKIIFHMVFDKRIIVKESIADLTPDDFLK